MSLRHIGPYQPIHALPRISHAQTEQFERLQEQFAEQYQQIFDNKMEPRAVVIIPSLTLDREILKRVKGHYYYEERMLCLLMLLRMPRTYLTIVTSVPIDPVIVDYYLHLLPGITSYHARQRLTLLSCFDGSAKPLTDKILERPRLIQRIRQSIPANHPAHISFFNVTEKERELALQLNLPIYGTNPDLNFLGTKSGSRKIFKACGIPLPDGFEDVQNEEEVIEKLALLKQMHPGLQKAVIKLNDGFSGDGNAIFSYKDAPNGNRLEDWIRDQLPHRLQIIAERLHYDTFFEKLEHMQAIVEVFIDGSEKASPSVQCRINPIGNVSVLSTHDQVLDPESGQIFLGATFPANHEYAPDLGRIGELAGEELKRRGVLGRFGIDFMSVKESTGWKHYAIEINLRKGGTTHPYLMLQFLTEGEYDATQGSFFMHDHKERFYFATDNLQRDCYKGLTPHDLIDIAMCNGLHYNGATEEGVVFHLISALSQYGKLGLVCIGSTPERATGFYNKVVEVLNRECDS
jgi:hypothetical protein